MSGLEGLGPLIIAHGAKVANREFIRYLKSQGVECRQIEGPQDLAQLKAAACILDAELMQKALPAQWTDLTVDTLLLAEQHLHIECDFLLPIGMPNQITLKSLEQACKQWALKQRVKNIEQTLHVEHDQLFKLTRIGIALSSEKDLGALLNRIISEGQRLASCDAASLFLVDKRDKAAPKLVFKLTRNDSIEFHFEEKSFPLDSNSIAGYVALSGKELNIDDVYELDTDCEYQFNRTFDAAMNYRTRSMLVVPMRNYRGEVVGVLQFLNRKPDAKLILDSPEKALEHTIPFDAAITEVLRSLASQAAVSIENSVLLENISSLFDGFVQASVNAIEQRDPTTSGHSFRVADLTTQLATNLPSSGIAEFKNISFSESQMKEIRYASLLHDFGKVGVREWVLVKEKKLTSEGLIEFKYRVQLERERATSRLYKTLYESLQAGLLNQQKRHELEAQCQQRLDQLEKFLHAVVEANEPTILPDGTFEHLQAIRDYPFLNMDGEQQNLLTDNEFMALSIRKGSLTEDERLEIQSHVTHTVDFLKRIPWTPELSGVTQIAGSHHEKLDGSGYPKGRHESEIPLASKMMTVCDIFDALTASDRPYKQAMPLERALGILSIEAEHGMLDKTLVNIFVESKTYKVIEGKDYKEDREHHGQKFAHSTCDIEFHKH